MSECWTVSFDDGRVGVFVSEQDARDFAHFDSQLEGVAAAVMRYNEDGTTTVIEFLNDESAP